MVAGVKFIVWRLKNTKAKEKNDIDGNSMSFFCGRKCLKNKDLMQLRGV